MALDSQAGGGKGFKQTHSLVKGHELRIEVNDGQTVLVGLLDGAAEIFGTELARGQVVVLKGRKIAVFTWHGCKLQLASETASLEEAVDVVYEADETPMVSYLNVHDVLEQRRRAACAAGTQGPRTIVVGPTDSGKSTLCTILLNYAVRMGWAPTMVDLDIGQGSITCPGSIAATPIEMPVDVEEGLPVEVPLVHYYGHVTPTENPELYRFEVDRLAAVLDRRSQPGTDVAAAGMVINSMGWVDGLGYELLLHSIQALKADVVLVVGQEKLYSQLSAVYRARQEISVVKVAMSGGVFTRSTAYRKAARTARVKEYFYGVHGDLSPHSQTARYADLHVFRVGGGPRAPTSALPIGATSVADPLRLAPVLLGNDLLHSLVAVSHATSAEQLLSANIAGFLYVTNVDVARGTLTYLAPCPGPLPGKFLLAGSIKVYFD